MRGVALQCIFLVCVVCVVAQQADLENLYKSTNGVQWTNNANWLVGDPCTNQWFGITCVNGSIIAIDLTNNNLDGTLPFTLNIPSLTKLYLGYNGNLTGEIPQYTNTNISEICLNNTQLHGEFPDWFTQLPYLTTISLSSTNLSGDFPVSWCNLAQLQVLNLGEQDLTGTLPDCIGNMTSLQSLTIYTTPLHGSIPTSITNLVNLQVLELNYNLLSGSIPENIGQMTSLAHITLYDNQLEGPIPASIGSLQYLQEFRVRNNKMTGAIPASLQKAQQLNTLGLASNYFSGTIPSFLSSQDMPKLLSIDLRCNEFVGPLPIWLKDDPAMKSDVQVWFGCNNITQSLPKWCLSQSRCGENACDGSRCYNPSGNNGPNKAVIIPLAIFLGLLLFGNVLLIIFLVKKKCLNRRSTSELKPILGLTPRYSNY